MKRSLAIVIATAGVFLAGQAVAAEMDMSKLTCQQLAAMPAAKTIGVAMWASGFVHGKAGNAMIDTDVAHANAEKIAGYCKSNPTATLESAVGTLDKP